VDVDTAESIVVLEDAKSNIGDITFSPSGDWIVAGCDDHKIYVWDASDYQLVDTLVGHQSYVNGVDFNTDETLLVSGSGQHDKTIGLWSFQDGRLLKQLEGHEDSILRVDMNPDDTLIASISWDGTVRLWGIPAPATAAGPGISFVDSSQRLGAGGNLLDAALGDLDGDGDLDAVVGNGEHEEGNAVLLNDGAGTLVDSGQSFGRVSGLALGDVDGDGDLDAFTVTGNRAGRVWLNARGTCVDSGQRLSAVHGLKVALGDLDGDGDLDAFVARQQEPNMVWLNDGGLQGGTPGNFTDSGQSLWQGTSEYVTLGDLDGDGDLDALTAGFDEPANVWFNDGTGVLNAGGQISELDPVRGIALGDADGDGDLDAFVTILGLRSEWLWYNAGGVQGGTPGTFVDSGQSLSGSFVSGLALGDLDGDGDLDAFIGVDTGGPDGVSSGNMVWLNDGGVFSDSGLRLGEGSSQSIVLGDLDGDGDLDALVVNREEFSAVQSFPGALITHKVWFNTTAR
jgi:WD40 repeat protein